MKIKQYIVYLLTINYSIFINIVCGNILLYNVKKFAILLKEIFIKGNRKIRFMKSNYENTK